LYRQNVAARERAKRVIAIFRQHGATAPEKAMTSAQLGLPERFDEFMDRRGGRAGAIVEVSKGKYYLNEARLREIASNAGSFANRTVIIKEKEIVKIRCPYCGNLYDGSLDKCPHCGAGR
jgi:hypothetical protein